MFDKRWKLINGDFDEPVSEVIADREEKYFEKILRSAVGCDRDSFLCPSLENMHSPYLLPDIEPCVERIMDAVDNGEHIAVFGDYDCDGVTATAILYDFLSNQLEADVEYMLPDRFGDGFGLSENAIDTAKKYGTSLIITVDNGTSAGKEIKYAASVGVDVIVTDHHDALSELPVCVAVVNPMRKDSVYPTPQLCGAGVAFKIVAALSLELGLDDYVKYLPLVALGTVADVVPVIGENRIFVRNGLEMMPESEFPGVRILLDKSGYTNEKSLNTELISFGIAPKINAAGRIEKADTACELLLSTTDYEAEKIYDELILLNDKRREIEDNITAECTPESGNLISGPDKRIIIAEKDDWHQGVLGLAASKLVSKYGKPVFVLSLDKVLPGGRKVLKASGRGTDSVNLTDLLSNLGDILLKYGGHSKAAGFSIYEDKLIEFSERANSFLYDTKTKIVGTESALMYLPPDLLTLSLAKKLSEMEPYGEGNQRPVFYTDGVVRVEPTTVKDGKHLKVSLNFKNGINVQGISFNNGRYAGMLSGGFNGGIIYTFDINNYRGEELQLKILDFVEWYGHYGAMPEDVYRFTRDTQAALYTWLKKIGKRFTFSQISDLKSRTVRDENVPLEAKNNFTWFKIKYGLDVFVELGFIIKIKTGCYEFADNPVNKNLAESSLYTELADNDR